MVIKQLFDAWAVSKPENIPVETAQCVLIPLAVKKNCKQSTEIKEDNFILWKMFNISALTCTISAV